MVRQGSPEPFGFAQDKLRRRAHHERENPTPREREKPTLSVRPRIGSGAGSEAVEGFLFVKRTSETVDYPGFVKFLHCLFAALIASVHDKPRNDSKKGPRSLFNRKGSRRFDPPSSLFP